MKQIQTILSGIKVDQELVTIQMSKAGTEAISIKSLRGHIQDMTSKSRELLLFLSNLTGAKVTELYPLDYRLNKDVLNGRYALVADKVVYKPVGFSGEILEFLTYLDSKSETMIECQDSVRAAKRIFASYINNPAELTKVTTGKLPALVKTKDMLEEMSEFFEGKEGLDREGFGVLYRRFADFNKSTDVLIDLSKKFKDASVTKMKTEADELYEILDRLDKVIDEEAIRLSPSAAKAIAAVIYNIADWLGVYSLFITKLIAVAHSHRDTAQKLNSLF